MISSRPPVSYQRLDKVSLFLVCVKTLCICQYSIVCVFWYSNNTLRQINVPQSSFQRDEFTCKHKGRCSGRGGRKQHLSYTDTHTHGTSNMANKSVVHQYTKRACTECKKAVCSRMEGGECSTQKCTVETNSDRHTNNKQWEKREWGRVKMWRTPKGHI